MAVTTQQGITKLTPTAWKWFTGGALLFFLMPPLGTIVAIIFFLVGSGQMQRLTLTREGLELRNWFSTRTYRWEDIGDFRVRKVKSGLITAGSMVSFTHVNKEGTMIGKAAKLLAGGTHSIPVIGTSAIVLAQLMHAYKGGHVPADTVTALPDMPTAPEIPEYEAASPIGLPEPRPSKPQPKPRPRAVPATPRAQSKAAPRKKGPPLVQDGGGLFGRRRPSSPFGS
ncbi:MAG: PH domain-containing protein [Pseudomonadota bacterium]